MIERTSTLQTLSSLSGYIQESSSKYNKLSEEASSGRKVTTLSDEPASTKTLMDINTQLDQLSGYLDTMKTTQTELDTVDSSLSSLTTIIQKATDLATEAANGTYNPSDLKNIQNQITEITKSVVDIANTQYDGNYIYAGAATAQKPYTITYDTTTGAINGITYSGTPSSGNYQRYVTISDGVSVPINTSGDQIFGSYSSTDPTKCSGLLNTLMTLNTALGTNNKTAISSTLTGLDTALNNITAVQTKSAAISNRFELTQSNIDSTTTTLKSYRSDLRDADLSEVMSDLAVQQTALQASYKIFETVNGMSLLDYLR